MNKIEELKNGINHLNLKDITVTQIESIICNFGLAFDKKCDYGEYKKFMVSQRVDLGVYQTPRQFAECIFELLKYEINTYLEIGLFNGGSYLIMTSFLRWKNPEIKCTGVDITDKYMLPEVKDRLDGFIRGTSSDLKGQHFDLVFIDGDHHYRKIKKDWENVGRYADMAIFHDINERTCPDVKRFWNEIKPGKEFKEYVYQTEGNPVMGIGLIFNTKVDDYDDLNNGGQLNGKHRKTNSPYPENKEGGSLRWLKDLFRKK